MSLAQRIAERAATANRSNRGCVTCKWLTDLSAADRRAWDDWIAEDKSLTQLWDIATADPVNPLRISITGLRHHVKHHKAADES